MLLYKFNKLLILFTVASCLFLVPVVAVAEDPGYGVNTSLNETGDPGELFDLINSSIEVYNQNLNLTPDIVKSLVGDEQILFVITLENGEEMYVWGTTENAEFVEFEKLDALTDQEPSLTIKSNESAIHSIIESPSPVEEFNEAVKSGDTKVEDAGLLQRLILWAMSIGLADLFM